MRRWLLSDDIGARHGAILSWANPHHPGYAYPEAAGLFLSTVCGSAFAAQAWQAPADRSAAWLCAALDADGGVGRGGITYLFDSAVALAGLLRYRAAGGRVGGDEPIHRLRAFICAQIPAGVAVLPPSASADGRWSTQFGAHLVKCLHSLHLYAAAFGDRVRDDLVAALINRSGHQPSPLYLHPFCYEQEGHFIVAHYGLPSLFEPVDGALDLLVALQQPNGGLLAFANGMDGFGEPRADATAQAVRLWLLRDRTRYAASIARGLAFLASCQTAAGGIRYAPARDDVCSWSTMFSLQAVEWFATAPRPDELL
ncbi:MAG: hypothetical protein ABI629_13905 [bacterium]